LDGQRFAISYDKTAWLATFSGVGPNSSRVDVDTGQVRVRMGSAFRLDIPRDHIRSVRRSQLKPRGTRGVHGWRGRWLVNGSAQGLVDVVIDPPCRTERGLGTVFLRAKVRLLTLSLTDPDGFMAALEPIKNP
jgi:hypothetical protein